MTPQLAYPLPPGFHGLSPHKPIDFYLRHLPHWRQDGATYAVTFRLADSIPQARLRELRHLRKTWEATHPEPRTDADWQAYARQYTRQVKAWMDEGHGACHLRDRDLAAIVTESLLHFNGDHYELGAFVVMPNHCHAVVRPFNDWQVEAIVGTWKQYTALRLNRALGLQGHFGRARLSIELSATEFTFGTAFSISATIHKTRD
ncbi:MAG: putative transposase [Rhodothermales bacterium]|jgi:putative transposase